MPLNDPVPSSAFDVLQRNAQDLDKYLNQDSGTFTNRTGDSLTPIPAVAAQVDASIIAAQAAIAADVAAVDLAAAAGITDISSDVSAVDTAAAAALVDINTAAEQIPTAIQLIGGDWQFYTDITTIPTQGLVAGNRATDLDSGLQYQWAFYEGTNDGFWTPFLAGWGAPSHQNLPSRNAPNAHEASAINMGGGLSLGDLLLKPISSVAELRNTEGLLDGQQVNLISRDGVSSVGGGRLVWRASATNADDDVRWFAVAGVATGRWELVSGQIVSDLTVRIPSDFATLQEAIDSIHGRIIPAQGVIVDLLIETGHQPTSGVGVRNGDYGYFRISSADPMVVLAPSFNTGADLLSAINAKSPILNCLVDAVGRCRYGINAQNFADAEVSSGCGVRNPILRGVYANQSSNVKCDFSDFTGVGSIGGNSLSRGAWIARGSTMIAEGADFSNSVGVGVYISRASTVHAMNLTVLNAGANAIWCHRASRITAHSSGGNGTRLSSNSSSPAVRVDRSSIAAINGDESPGVTITQNGTGDGVSATGSSSLNINFAVLNGGASSGTGIATGGSASVSAQSAQISGFDINVENNFSTVDLALSSLSNARGTGVLSTRGRTNLTSAYSTGSPAGRDIITSNGSWVTAAGCTTTNGAGSPALADTNMPSFNAITSNRGIVFT